MAPSIRCERRGWHGPTVTLLARAAQLEPASVDAQLALATALLRCGRASEARETFAAARQREEDRIEALVGEKRGAVVSTCMRLIATDCD
jgi:thioredoxin-like negative regulator of GroEL